MKRMIAVFLLVAVLLTFASCGAASNDSSASVSESGILPPAQQQENDSASAAPGTEEDAPPEQPASETAITLTVGDQTFSATLLGSETARQLVEQFPLTLNMNELNGNEKYFYMDRELPTDSYQPGQIHAGDLMLYGNSCLVLFYESFSSGYSYTRLGSVVDPAGLAGALGTGNVEVIFSVGDNG